MSAPEAERGESGREDALEQIRAIARAHGITGAEIAAALADQPRADGTSIVGRMLAWLGGTFVLAGLGVFISLNWDVMNTAARIVITLGSGLAALVFGLVASRDARYERAEPPLFLLAAALQATGILVAIDEFSTGGDWRYAVLAMTLVMGLQQAALLQKLRIHALVFTTIAFAAGFASTGLDLLEAAGDVNAAVVGASLAILAFGLARTPFRTQSGFWMLVGSATCMMGLFELLRGTPIELGYLALACGAVALSAYARSRVLLAVGTIALLGYISYFTADRLLDVWGWPLALIALGIVLLGVSLAAMRLHRRYLAAG